MVSLLIYMVLAVPVYIDLRTSINMLFVHLRKKKVAGCGKGLHHVAKYRWIVGT